MMSKTRARSKEAKEEQIQRIVDAARDLFFESGSKGFKMRTLADKVKMSAGNIYNYWSSKRELWFDIVKRDFEELENAMQKILHENEGNFLETLEILADFYFNFANENFRRYQMMFLLTAPHADVKGEHEKDFEPQSINILLNFVQNFQNEGLIPKIDVKKLSVFLWSIMHGSVLVSHSILFDSRYETAIFGSKEEFQEYIKTQIKNYLVIQLNK